MRLFHVLHRDFHGKVLKYSTRLVEIFNSSWAARERRCRWLICDRRLIRNTLFLNRIFFRNLKMSG
jgi:hypothetical protein